MSDGGAVPWPVLFQVAVMLVAGLAAALSIVLWNAVQSLRTDLSTLANVVADMERRIAERYLRRDDFSDHARRVEAALERIAEKLDGKADKVRGYDGG